MNNRLKMNDISFEEMSPMMRQYVNLKNQYTDSILFFRLGDFYEMFFEDANLVSSEIGITLTAKDCGKKDKKAPMCGIPYHSAEAYIARLVAKGYKIAMCDQLGNPAESKGLVKREVVRVITPGTVMEQSMLDESRNNYICSIYFSENFPIAGISFCDVSTGELKTTEIYGSNNKIINQLKLELGKFSPREVLCIFKGKVYESVISFIKEKLECNVEQLEDNLNETDSKNLVIEKLKFKNFENLNISNKISSLKSIAYLLKYLELTQKGSLKHISLPDVYDKSLYIGLDLNTIKNLELLETIRTKSKKGSLLSVLDKTKTAMGKRLIRNWIESPLLSIDKILLRQGAVEEFVNDTALRENLKETLSQIQDLQRLMTKITYASANARDLKSLSSGISNFPNMKSILEKCNCKILKNMYLKFDTLDDVFNLIENAIDDKPVITLKEGKIIKKGYSAEVDSLRKDIDGGKDIIVQIEERERKRTGITKLKVSYNKVFGYFIEVTNSFKKLVPDDYIRKQTLTNCERYITQELKELESRIMYAKDMINEIEFKIFEDVRNKVAKSFSKVIDVSNIISAIDALVSLAEVAVYNNYVKPTINGGDKINIKKGRHPVIETIIKDNTFVPNDILLDNYENNVILITGPNMAGKSTYMRQTALIVIMAQMGGFVPAEKAEIGIVDSIFTRIGASDDLTAGQSTFMVEMSEVGDIIKNSSSKSLLIFDEIGRGTSTFDGLSIARAVLEYVADKTILGAKTLFSTHYHELTEISKEFNNIKNYSVSVEKNDDNIVFLHTIVPGIASESYGIGVAKLAGLPENIISRSKEILNQLQNSSNTKNKIKTSKKPLDVKKLKDSIDYNIVSELKNINISSLTPIESMNVLYRLIGMTKTEDKD